MTAIKESATLSKSGKKFRIRLLSEGVGSSGTYPAEVLERDGAAAFPAGTHIYWDHLTESQEIDRGGSHSIKDLVGVTESDAEYAPETKSLHADAKFFTGTDFIQEAMEHIALSIEAGATISADRVIESFVPSPFNAIAVVPRGGRDGKIERLIESYRESDESGKIAHEDANNASTETGKDGAMTPEQITALVESLSTAVKTAVTEGFTEIKESLVPAAPNADEVEGSKPSEIVEALVEADLPKALREQVLAQIDADPKTDVAEAITKAQALVKDVLENAGIENEPGVIRTTEKAGSSLSQIVKGA